MTIDSGRELLFDPRQPIELPCASLDRRDNNTAEGVQHCIEEQAQAEALALGDHTDAGGSRADSADAHPPGERREEEGVPEDDLSEL